MFAELAQPRPPEARPAGNSGRFVEQRSARTLDGYRRTLRAALNAAIRRGLISMNVTEGRIDALPRSRRPELRWWETEETARFLESVTGDELGALFEVAAYTGPRRSELLGLRWIDVDEHGLTVRQTLVSLEGVHSCTVCGASHKGRYIKPSTKSDAGNRWVPLVKPAAEALRGHRKAQNEQRKAFGADYAEHFLVFCRADGNPLRPDMVTRRFETLTDAIRFPKDAAQPDGTPTPERKRRRLTRIRLHDLRHGAASLLLAGGVPIELVAMILGHSSPAVTRRIYAHVLRGHTRDLVGVASELLARHRPSSDTSSENLIDQPIRPKL